jgi:hypothetical protein
MNINKINQKINNYKIHYKQIKINKIKLINMLIRIK